VVLVCASKLFLSSPLSRTLSRLPYCSSTRVAESDHLPPSPYTTARSQPRSRPRSRLQWRRTIHLRPVRAPLLSSRTRKATRLRRCQCRRPQPAPSSSPSPWEARALHRPRELGPVPTPPPEVRLVATLSASASPSPRVLPIRVTRHLPSSLSPNPGLHHRTRRQPPRLHQRTPGHLLPAFPVPPSPLPRMRSPCATLP
jgi:hypothetical protein